jgi:hypothetical protein
MGVIKAPGGLGIEVPCLGIGQGTAIMAGVAIFARLTYRHVILGQSPEPLQLVAVQHRCQSLFKAIPDYLVAGKYAGSYLSCRGDGHLASPTAVVFSIKMKGMPVGPETGLSHLTGKLRREVEGL